MNTPVETSADVKPADQSYEEIVAAVLAQRARESGIEALSLKITSCTDPTYRCIASNEQHVTFGATIDQCIESMRPLIKTPQQIAEAKRAAAQKLIAEAEAIETAMAEEKMEVVE